MSSRFPTPPLFGVRGCDELACHVMCDNGSATCSSLTRGQFGSVAVLPSAAEFCIYGIVNEVYL